MILLFRITILYALIKEKNYHNIMSFNFTMLDGVKLHLNDAKLE